MNDLNQDIERLFPVVAANTETLISRKESVCWECVEFRDYLESHDGKFYSKDLFENLWCLSSDGWRWALPYCLRLYSSDEGDYFLERFLYSLSNSQVVADYLFWLSIDQKALLIKFLNHLTKDKMRFESFHEEIEVAVSYLSRKSP